MIWLRDDLTDKHKDGCLDVRKIKELNDECMDKYI